MKTIKIIDLLNDRANGKEMPKIIRVKSYRQSFKWIEEYDEYINIDDEDIGLFNECILDCKDLQTFLNEEVEIIEETKNTKKIKIITVESSDLAEAINTIVDYIHESKKESE